MDEQEISDLEDFIGGLQEALKNASPGSAEYKALRVEEFSALIKLSSLRMGDFVATSHTGMVSGPSFGYSFSFQSEIKYGSSLLRREVDSFAYDAITNRFPEINSDTKIIRANLFGVTFRVINDDRQGKDWTKWKDPFSFTLKYLDYPIYATRVQDPITGKSTLVKFVYDKKNNTLYLYTEIIPQR